MTETTDIKALSDRLRSLAKTATPGKWWIDSHGEALVAITDEGIETVLKPEHLRDKAHRDESTGSLSYWPNDSDASWIAAAQPQNIIALLDRFETERQRADDGVKAHRVHAARLIDERGQLRERAEKAEAEIAALKGEQVPYGYYSAETATILEQQGHASISAEPLADSRLPLFTAPQKPVISKEKLCDWLEDNFDIDDSQRDAFAQCFANHCGCIVKEAE